MSLYSRVSIPMLLALPFLWYGCGDEDAPSQPAPNVAPLNDSAQGAIERFIWAYENRDIDTYESLFTGDFTFEFSDADPELKNEYATGWFKEDEMISARNLFHGGVNDGGSTVESASSISLALQSTAPAPDTSQGRDPSHFKTLLSPVRLDVEIGEDTFIVGAGIDVTRHRWYLVRGDAAVGLESTQIADASRWYIHRWNDEAPAYAGSIRADSDATARPGSPKESSETSWGSLKGFYR